MEKTNIMHRIMKQQIDFGLKVLIPYVSRFPRETYNALAQHPLCHEKDSGELRFRNGAVVTFKKMAELSEPSYTSLHSSPIYKMYDEEVTRGEWPDTQIPEFVRTKAKGRGLLGWLWGRFHGEA